MKLLIRIAIRLKAVNELIKLKKATANLMTENIYWNKNVQVRRHNYMMVNCKNACFEDVVRDF